MNILDAAGRERVKCQPKYRTFLFLALMFAVDGTMEMGTLEFSLGIFGWFKCWCSPRDPVFKEIS